MRLIGELTLIDGRMSYPAFAISSSEDLRNSWTTEDQRAWNLSHSLCTTCSGRGYKVSRSRGVLVRDAAGCPVCHGLGVVESTAVLQSEAELAVI
jgi:hypothetical protein